MLLPTVGVEYLCCRAVVGSYATPRIPWFRRETRATANKSLVPAVLLHSSYVSYVDVQRVVYDIYQLHVYVLTAVVNTGLDRESGVRV
jgi:hypothetical protein